MSHTIEIKIDLDKPDVNVTWSKLAGHPLFYKYLGKMALIHALKNLDYGDGDPLGNFKFSEEITGIPAWKGALVRLTDKWGRIKSLLKKEKAYVQDETLEDTLLDNAVYSLLVLALREQEISNVCASEKLDTASYFGIGQIGGR